MSSALAHRARKYVDSLHLRPNTFGAPAVLTAHEARTTCSTFLGLLLREVFNEAPPRRMRAREWFDYFELSAKHLNLRDVSPGDVGLISYDEDRGGMSGHCFIVVDGPVLAAELAGTKHWAVGIVDSCRSHHGLADTREDSPGGIGHGVMELRTDLEGNIKGYRWSLGAASEVMHNGEGQQVALFAVPDTWTFKENRNG